MEIPAIRQKYLAKRRIFNPLLGVWKCGQTRSLVFDILLGNRGRAQASHLPAQDKHNLRLGSFFSQPCNGINKNGRHCCLEHLKREAKESEERREARLYPVTIPRANARWDSIQIASHFHSAELHSNSSNAHTRGNLSQKCTVYRYQMAPTLTIAVLFNSLPGSTVKTVFGFAYIGIRSCCSCDVSVSRTIPSRVGSNRVNRDCASSSPTSLELKFPCVLKFIEAYITNLL